MFFLMSLLFYWILDSKKYTWIIRISTFVICTIIGGIGSEYIQHLISPFRTFDHYDILANVSGSLFAIIISEIYRYFYIGKQYTELNTEISLQDV
jgi:VanZ family protein